jgi:uncharacterized protein (DUF1015 family)
VRLHPFRALRPAPGLAARIVAPPYDVVSREEARRLAGGNPLSFLHVARPDIDVPDDLDPHDERVYRMGRERLDRLVAEGALVRDAEPALYLYREVMGERAQVGVVGCVHVDDYEGGLIRRHEATRPDKEADRTRHALALGAHAEPVLLMYRGSPAIDRLVTEGVAAPPLADVLAEDGVRHTVWRLADPAAMVEAFQAVPRAYVGDGHHRSASAWRAAQARRAQDPTGRSGREHEWFLAVLFAADQLRIYAYNRVVRDLGGQTAAAVLERLGKVGRLSATTEPVPPRPGSFCIYLGAQWHLLELSQASVDRGDAVGALDVTLLQERVLGPILGIADQRTDARIDFVGGGSGTRALERLVDAGEAALAVSMRPVTVEELMAVADAGGMMPPKSTWFAPKLASGLFVHAMD